MEQIKLKEIEVYKKEVAGAASFSKTLAIKNQDDYERAFSEGKKIKDRLDEIVARKEEITKPMNSALKSIRELFKPIEMAGGEAIRVIKNKMLVYTTEQTRKAEETKLKLAGRVERGTMKVDTAVRKIGEVETPEKTTVTADGRATTVTCKAWRVVDKSKIPLEFMEPDMVAIKASFRSGKPVAGVEEYADQGIKFGKIKISNY